MAVSCIILATGLLCIPKVHKMGTGKIRDGKEYKFHVNFQKTIIERLFKLKKKKDGDGSWGRRARRAPLLHVSCKACLQHTLTSQTGGRGQFGSKLYFQGK